MYNYNLILENNLFKINTEHNHTTLKKMNELDLVYLIC